MLLAIDTSTRSAGVALYNGVQVLSEVIWISHDYHTVELAPVIVEVLNRVGKTITDVQAVAVAIGPGSFTGLRIGLAVAKGISLSGAQALIGVPTLDIVAASQPVLEMPLAVVLQAGRGRLAVGWYQASHGDWAFVPPYEIMSVQDLAARIKRPTLVSGELRDAEQQLLRRKRRNVLLASPSHSVRRPSHLAELAWRRWKRGLVDDPASLSPIYLHVGVPIPG